MKLNEQAFDHAKSLIVAGKVVRDSEWIDIQLSSADEEKRLQETDWEEYRKWFLGIDTEKKEHDTLRCLYKYGDFEAVHRSGLLDAQKKSMLNGHPEITIAINQLIVQIDKEPDIVSEASDESFPASDPPNWHGRR